MIRGRFWVQRARQKLLDLIIAQTETDPQHRNPDLERAASFYGLELAQPHTQGLGVGPVSISQSERLFNHLQHPSNEEQQW
jgi:hypothetical protein